MLQGLSLSPMVLLCSGLVLKQHTFGRRWKFSSICKFFPSELSFALALPPLPLSYGCLVLDFGMVLKEGTH